MAREFARPKEVRTEDALPDGAPYAMNPRSQNMKRAAAVDGRRTSPKRAALSMSGNALTPRSVHSRRLLLEGRKTACVANASLDTRGRWMTGILAERQNWRKRRQKHLKGAKLDFSKEKATSHRIDLHVFPTPSERPHRRASTRRRIRSTSKMKGRCPRGHLVSSTERN